jgi:hypothetical protein
MRKLALLVLALVLVPTAASAGPVIVAVGDIHPRSHPGVAARTAALVQEINPDRVLTLGDAQYGNGTFEEYLAGYDNTWGVFKPITAPVPGEHDYRTHRAAGYREYFSDHATGPYGATYYSYKINRWGMIALDSNIARDELSEQERWLFFQIARWDNRNCILAYWHHPRYSSGEVHGSYPSMDILWRWLSVGNAEVALSAHERSYERFARLDGSGGRRSYGMRQFVVGTGGAPLTGFGDPERHSQVRIDGRHGVLVLELRHESYRWEFVATDGEVLDHGAELC